MIKKIKDLMLCEDLIIKLETRYKKLEEEHTPDSDGCGPSPETYQMWWDGNEERKEIEKRLETLRGCYEELKEEKRNED